MCCAIDRMILPTATEMSPDTPLSISSKIIVGRRLRSVTTDFTESIRRDNSPPEATSDNGRIPPPLLALNSSRTLSCPSGP